MHEKSPASEPDVLGRDQASACARRGARGRPEKTKNVGPACSPAGAHPWRMLLAPTAISAEIVLAGERARAYAAAAKSDNTRRTYASQWGLFERWCAARSLPALPAATETVVAYLVELADAGRAAATIELALVAVSQRHALAGHPSPREHPVVKAVRQGIRRTIGTAQEGKAPLLAAELRRALEEAPERATRLATLRDRALLLIGWSGAFRRSEIVAFELAHVRFVPEGVELFIRRGKTDQTGEGRWVPLPSGRDPITCPVRALRAWLAEAGITSGRVFRRVDHWGHVGPSLGAHAVYQLVRRAAAAAGLDESAFGGHSLRSGLVTEAARRGRGEAAIMKITGHTSVIMVRRYMKNAKRWEDVASQGLLDGS